MIHDNPRAPGDSQRLAARTRPAGGAVMYQRWSDLLFLHWEYPAQAIQAKLPDGLFVDTFDGSAYLGVVPFFMRNIRPRFLPAVPRISNFMEMNLRTYVHDRAGVPGVWFYSLDANQWLAVKIARRFFHLPYEHAEMKSTRTAEGRIRYESQRTGARTSGMRCVFDYAPGAEVPQPAPGSLEFFLVERYRRYSSAPRGLWRGAVFHEPYPLCRADVTAWDENLLPLDGFAPTGRAPDHVIMSRGVDVTIYPLERAATA
ncbi:MAG: YqjF family protein [Verrucomicrobiales bacterium]